MMQQGNKKDKDTAQIHKEVEKQFPDKTKQLIRATRVKPAGEPLGIPGVNSIGEQTSLRTGMLGECKTQIESLSSVRVQDKWLQLAKKPYIAHLKLYYGESDEEANNFTCHLYLPPMTPSTTIVNGS